MAEMATLTKAQLIKALETYNDEDYISIHTTEGIKSIVDVDLYFRGCLLVAR